MTKKVHRAASPPCGENGVIFEEYKSLTKSLAGAASIKIAPHEVTLRHLKRAGAAPHLAVMARA